MQNENTDHYQWAMRQIASIYDGVDYPRVFSTDREEALVSAIMSVFLYQTICFAHGIYYEI
jgi:hypothetical protein